MTSQHQRRFDQDLKFQRAEWRAQRVGWVLLALFIIAAGLGVFGEGGFLAQASGRSADGTLTVEYKRLVRQQTATALDIQAYVRTEASSELRLWILRSYLDAVAITAITPEPDRVILDGPRTTFVFRVAPGSRAHALRFDLQVRRAGRLFGAVGLAGAGSIHFSQFAFF